jgi:hypothetical protein
MSTSHAMLVGDGLGDWDHEVGAEETEAEEAGSV